MKDFLLMTMGFTSQEVKVTEFLSIFTAACFGSRMYLVTQFWFT